VQRTKITAQVEIDLEDETSANEAILNGYIYRTIANNHDSTTNSEDIHWFNQRAEDSENRIKKLKLDFGGNTLLCNDFKVNALYFLMCSMSDNLFALIRQLLPGNLAHHRITTIRWQLYAVAAKIVKTGRQLFVKLKSAHQKLLSQVLDELRRFKSIDG
jgi:hypothetical protein